MKPLPSTLAALLMAGACLSACAPSETQNAASASTSVGEEATTLSQAASQAEVSATASMDIGVTIGGDGSAIQMEPLTENDIESAKLGGELACSFSAGNTPPLLLATGIVASKEPAFGVVKIAGYVERIAAPGGYEGITTNPTFSGQGKTIIITTTGNPVGGGESPYRPATLTYQRADGASRVIAGTWTCGP